MLRRASRHDFHAHVASGRTATVLSHGVPLLLWTPKLLDVLPGGRLARAGSTDSKARLGYRKATASSRAMIAWLRAALAAPMQEDENLR